VIVARPRAIRHGCPGTPGPCRARTIVKLDRRRPRDFAIFGVLRRRGGTERRARTTGAASLAATQNGTSGVPRTTNALGVGQHAARGKPTSSVTAEVALPYNLPYKSHHLRSWAIVARLHQGRSGPVAPSRVIPSNPLYRFHTAEVGGSSPLAPTRKVQVSRVYAPADSRSEAFRARSVRDGAVSRV
jgi:hypothetical protein